MALTPAQFKEQLAHYVNAIKNGAVFIYPTDTIYGIGCDATNPAAVQELRLIKQRDTKPLSVIAPSKEWILDNCDLHANGKKWLDNLPGPYTLIVNVRNPVCVTQEVNHGSTLGVRIPHHWISEVVQAANIPVVTTSVNISGKPFARTITDIETAIIDAVDFVIDEGTLSGNPSTLVDLTGKQPIVKQR